MPFNSLDELLYDYEQYTCRELVQKYRSEMHTQTPLSLYDLISLKHLIVVGLPPSAPYVILEHIVDVIEHDRAILYDNERAKFMIILDLANGLEKY